VGDRLRYADVRPYAVPDSLGQLVGPASGVVELPAVNALSLRGRVFDAVCLLMIRCGLVV
jgi:hypothetical protein